MEHELIAQLTAPTLGQIAEAYPEVVADLRELDPVLGAAAFGALLTLPELQANCFRIQALVHLAVVFGEGVAAPTEEFVKKQFERLDSGICGQMEDPAEDLFTSRVDTPKGNVWIVEGLMEGAGFYLQRMLEIVESMPKEPPFVEIRNTVGAVLTTAGEVTKRAGIQESLTGRAEPISQIPEDCIAKLAAALEFIRFRDSSIDALGARHDAVKQFEFDLGRRRALLDQSMNHTGLGRRPFVRRKGELYCILPSESASAIIRFVIEMLESVGKGKAFEVALAREYSRLFTDSRILGKRIGRKIPFEWSERGFLASMMTEFDAGRYLHLMFTIDDLEGFSIDGLAGMNSNSEELSSILAKHLEASRAMAEKQAGFRGGMSLIVSCGYGRGFGLELEVAPHEKWRLESLSAYNLHTLSWLPEFDVLPLWRRSDGLDTNRWVAPYIVDWWSRISVDHILWPMWSSR